ncbi:MAG: PBP1A family penicillin-binding protein [bacterium]|nr:PBP1A family penicillin-binding protein [bacterium]
MFRRRRSVFASGERSFWLRFWVFITSGLLFILVGGFFLTVGLFVYFSKDLPSPGRLGAQNAAQSTKILDRNGEVLYDVFGDINREAVPFDQIPDIVKHATIAIEDKDFYKHQGFAVTGLMRALWTIVTARKLEGGSTITQQLVKNSLLSPERTLQRKVKEFILSIQVERRYSKDEILHMYLNTVPYGGQAWGVQAAAKTYLGKDVRDLTLPEAAVLAGLPQKPTAYSPFGSNPKAYKDRTQSVLRRMREEGYIAKEDEERARGEIEKDEIKFSAQEISIKAPHFTVYVRDMLIDRYGSQLVEQGGLRVTTSLDYKLQQEVQKIVAEEVKRLKGADVSNSAAVVMDPKNGQILAMVGSRDYFDKEIDGNVNVAFSLRQPGSATKPIMYAAAFQKGYTPATMIIDMKTEFPNGVGRPDYVPVNYDSKYHGPAQIRYALGNSYNIPAVKVLAMTGLANVMELAYTMGITTWEPTAENIQNVGLSLTLGGREVRLVDLVRAFASFAAGGSRKEFTPVLKVTDAKGQVLEETKDEQGTKVLSEEVAFLVNDILADNTARTAAFGPNSLLNIPGKTVSVKTGTTDEKRDNWTIGYTPSFVVGVWVGNNDNSPMSPQITSGVTGAAPIWSRIMRTVLSDRRDEPWQKPAKVQSVEVDGISGFLPGSYTFKKRFEYFIRGTEPTKQDTMTRMVKICKDGALATPVCEASGEVEEKVYTILEDPFVKNVCESCPPSDGSTTYTTLEGIPTGKGTIEIVNIANNANVPFEFDVLAKPKGGASFTSVTFYVDGTQQRTVNGEPFSHHVSFPASAIGEHQISVQAVDLTGDVSSTSITVNVRESL